MDFFISNAHAQTAAAQEPSALMTFLPLVVLVAVFYFLLIRPQNKRMKEHRELLSNLQKGDEVATSGGILGRVVDIQDSMVTLQVAPNVSIKVQKPAVAVVLPKGSLKSGD